MRAPPTPSGRPTDPKAVRNEFDHLITTAGIDGRSTPNLLRHTAASLMADAGLPIEHVDIDSLVDDMRLPTDDDVPMTSDWHPLDTKDKLLAYLNRTNEAREHDRAG